MGLSTLERVTWMGRRRGRTACFEKVYDPVNRHSQNGMHGRSARRLGVRTEMKTRAGIPRSEKRVGIAVQLA